jgi:hypothetical protein
MIETKIVPQPDGTVLIERYQDAEPVIDRVKALNETGPRRDSCMRFAGSVPNVLLEKWFNEIGFGNWRKMSGRERVEFLVRKLRDPEYAKLRGHGL